MGRTSTFDLTATYRTVEGGWVQAQIVELPGVVTAAPTRAEAEDLILDALQEYLLASGGGDGGPSVPEDAADGEGRLAVTIDAT